MVGVHQIRIEESTMADTGVSRFALGVYRFFLVFAGVSLLLTGFWQAMGLSVELTIYLFLGLISAYFVFALSWKRFSSLLLLPGVLLCFWQLYSQWELIQDGLYHLENAFIGKFNRFYEAELIKFITIHPSRTAVTALFSLVAVLLAFLLAVSVTHCRLRGCWLVAVLLFLGLGAWVDAFPETSFFLLLIVHCFLVWMSGSVKELSAGERARMLGFALLFLLAVMGLSRLLCNEPLYDAALEESKTRLALQSSLREMDIQKLMKEIGAKLDRMMSTGGGLGIGAGRSTAGMAGGELSRSTDGIRFTEETHLIVTLPKDSNQVYLRGFIGTNYTGERWEEISAKQQRQYFSDVVTTFGDSQNYTSSLIQAFFVYGNKAQIPAAASDYRLEEKHAYMDIKVAGANPDYYYAPYDTSSFTSAYNDADNCLKPSGSSQYTVGYYYNNELRPFYHVLGDVGRCDLSLLTTDFYASYDVRMALLGYIGDLQSELQRYNQEYRAYVESVYLDIPSECMGVRGVLKTTGTLEGDVKQVFLYLLDNYEYTLSPQPMESGEDYIEHFLFESKEGYCMHFASAATMLFRSLGIPARYVEGYVVRPVDIQKGKTVYEAEVETLTQEGSVEKETVPFVEVEVPDSAAHAWVEIYIENYGWYPVEVTAGYRTSFNFTALPTPTSAPATPTPDVSSAVSISPTPTSAAASPSGALPSRIPTGMPSPTGALSVTPSAETTLTPTPGEAGGDEQNGGGKLFGILWRVFAVLAVIALVLFAVLSGIGRWKRSRRAMLHSADGKQKMLAYYREILRILGLRGLVPEERERDEDFCLRAERELSGEAPRAAEAEPPETAKQDAASLLEVCRIAQKARFSRSAPEEAEAAYVARYYRRLRAEAHRESRGLRALWFRLTVV